MAISLDSIKSGTRLKAPKIVIYGVGGIGKTTWASHAPKPVFLFTEAGMGKLDVKRFELREDDPVLLDWVEILSCLQFLHENEHDFQTVVLDTIDFAEPLLHRFTAAKHHKESIEDFGYGKGYVYAVDEARELTRWLDALRNDRGMAIIIIGHSDTKKFEPPDDESYDRYKINLHDRLASHLHDWSDAFLFCKYRTTVVKDVEGSNPKGGERTRARATGIGERIMHTEERPAWRAKNRYSLPPELPLEWIAFQNAIADSTAPSKTATKKKK